MIYLISERTDKKLLLGTDWMKTLKVTIGRTQMAQNHSERKGSEILRIIREKKKQLKAFRHRLTESWSYIK